MEWISVNDRLPEFEQAVLCFWSEIGGGISTGRLMMIRTTSGSNGENTSQDWEVYTSIGTLDITVTHWIPLPEPPAHP